MDHWHSQWFVYGNQEASIGDSFTAPTASHVCKLLDEFGFQTIFGRSDVQKTLGLKPTRSAVPLREMTDNGFIEPVTDVGKGKYRFMNRQG